MCDRYSFVVVEPAAVVERGVLEWEDVRVFNLESHSMCVAAHRIRGPYAEVEYISHEDGVSDPVRGLALVDKHGPEDLYVRWDDKKAEAGLREIIRAYWPTSAHFLREVLDRTEGCVDAPDGVVYLDEQGRIHREGGPALSYVRPHEGGGSELIWMIHGQESNPEGGPTHIRLNCTGLRQCWMRPDGTLHRLDGPAIEDTATGPQYWVAGRRCDKVQYPAAVREWKRTHPEETGGAGQ